MIGIDTNILVRFFIRDDSTQADQAAIFLESCTEENPGFINAIVLAELVWVLEKSYKYNRCQVYSVLEKLLDTRELIIQHSDSARHAVNSYLQSKAGFNDLYIGSINRFYGCPFTKTFDRSAAESTSFELV